MNIQNKFRTRRESDFTQLYKIPPGLKKLVVMLDSPCLSGRFSTPREAIKKTSREKNEFSGSLVTSMLLPKSFFLCLGFHLLDSSVLIQTFYRFSDPFIFKLNFWHSECETRQGHVRSDSLTCSAFVCNTIHRLKP